MHAILSYTYSFIYDSIIIGGHDTCLTLLVKAIIGSSVTHQNL